MFLISNKLIQIYVKEHSRKMLKNFFFSNPQEDSQIYNLLLTEHPVIVDYVFPNKKIKNQS